MKMQATFKHAHDFKRDPLQCGHAACTVQGGEVRGCGPTSFRLGHNKPWLFKPHESHRAWRRLEGLAMLAGGGVAEDATVPLLYDELEGSDIDTLGNCLFCCIQPLLVAAGRPHSWTSKVPTVNAFCVIKH